MQTPASIRLGNNIRNRRLFLRYKQKEIADKAQVSCAHMSSIEHGKRTPHLLVLLAIANVLETSASELMYGVK